MARGERRAPIAAWEHPIMERSGTMSCIAPLTVRDGLVTAAVFLLPWVRSHTAMQAPGEDNTGGAVTWRHRTMAATPPDIDADSDRQHYPLPHNTIIQLLLQTYDENIDFILEARRQSGTGDKVL